MSAPPLIRPMREDDLEAFAEITATSYYEVDTRTYQRAWPDPVRRPADRNGAWITRARAALRTDPGGCWVAEVDGEVVGGAVSRVRELMWVLASFAVRPGHQGQGIGAQLMAAAMHHGRGCLRGMFAASADPGAVRRYRLAGFDLHPQMTVTGVVDRSALPVVERVREGSAADVDLLDSIDRRTRGAAHLSDHELLLAQFRLAVVDHSTGSGYAYVDADGAPALLAATSRRTAAALMWEALASSAPGAQVSVPHITAANQWALDVSLAARMAIYSNGYLCVRHMKPPAPYLHHGSLL
ncbi:Acetyltransferase (GNAT) domain-containing protein [Nocardioides exalbidus]|uniref:Acetyltransferase (GNAT) domain-containing protein n=1 Tax=Nocardioides exalbidus TaxID=402596 RepID=A0A1H5A3P6_9ACTN|nr:GNAT family N-acetyltransferase [Nocardioides exalbidus]SED36902.1 Acetyltransferase (GNAT) domain-containing protein [Nocardioides exalbidus]